MSAEKSDLMSYSSRAAVGTAATPIRKRAQQPKLQAAAPPPPGGRTASEFACGSYRSLSSYCSCQRSSEYSSTSWHTSGWLNRRSVSFLYYFLAISAIADAILVFCNPCASFPLPFPQTWCLTLDATLAPACCCCSCFPYGYCSCS